ncbi:MAG: glycogen debranching enzyme family protein [Bacteroidales bacterium]|nr:glycogen debranching enzyme family protein [Bacteroidales bacterium]
MGYIEFDKSQLINLEYSLNKELIRTNRAGSYACSTIINCNTRKYHGLLVCPIEKFGGENYVLLSSLDETIIQHDAEFHLGIHKYSGEYYPRGHKYIRDYESDPIPAIIYRVGGVILKKEMILVEEEERMLIRYTLLDAHSLTKIRLQPFLAFRNAHDLTHANLDVNTKYQNIKNGVKIRMYQGFPYLHLQTSKKSEYIHVPDWNKNIEYLEEQKRGYEYSEDLFVPGYFETSIKKGESIIFSASTTEVNTISLKRQFENEIKKRTPRNNFENCLENSAQQFISRKKGKTKVIAGFPWFGHWARDTFIALPGLTLPFNDLDTYKEILDTMVNDMQGCFFTSEGNRTYIGRSSVDAPLWFFWAVQKYLEQTKSYSTVYKNYGETLKNILKSYKEGTDFNIKMHDNSLIWAGIDGEAITWMDAYINEKPVTPRIGYTVEINALWYNAVVFCLELAEKNNDVKFVKEWNKLPELISQSFIKTFWDKEKGYLADFVDDSSTNWDVRPNQMFAVSLPFSPIENKEIKKSILDIVTNELLTPKGIRTLSPKYPEYKGVYEGNHVQRDLAYHQGTTRPWLLGHFCEAYLKIHKKAGVSFVENLYKGFDDDIKEHGIGSVSEVYDGNPPYLPDGAISQACSVAELLRINLMVKNYS